MNTKPVRSITDEEIKRYEEDGVVHLKGFFDTAWIEMLRDKVETVKANPGRLSHQLSKREDSGEFFTDTFMWHQNDGFRDFIYESPAAATVAQILRSAKINIVFDQFLIKEPKTDEPTVWHHDLTYWPIRGSQVCTLWLALDEVTEETGSMEFVKGSHRWGQRFHPVAFVDPAKYKTDEPVVPDIDTMRDELDFMRFDYAPGDCTIHHGLLVHAAGGNKSCDRRRRAYVTRWAGSDVVYDPRPNIQEMLWDPGVAPGAPLDSDLWPVVVGS
jgi:ectoine hydroxylase-related dioxygenase (phytanoyl-CoA dioxygenase family)